MTANCYKCNDIINLEVGKDTSRFENCDKCNASIRCCKMCQFYDISSYNDCREPTADRVVEKDKANFCDFFKLGDGSNLNNDKASKALSAADALFKK